MEIDQALKQRIVGAIVITALLAIFVPMLFDDPVEESGQKVSDLEIPPTPEPDFETGVLPVKKTAEQVLEMPEPEKSADPETSFTEPVKIQENPKPKPEFNRWVVQVGSFGNKENAMVLRDKLRKQGFTAYSDSMRSKDNKLMYRVRVGPELDKKRALKTRDKIKETNKINAFVLKE